MKTKICSKCGKEKDVSEFFKDKSKKDGLCKHCKKCSKESFKKWIKNNTEKHKEIVKRWFQKHPHRHWAITTLSGHKQSGYKINITKDELEKMAKETVNCPICEVELDWSFGTKKGKRQPNSPSLDRKNNEKILNKDNVWIICNKCNITKSNRTMKEFIEYCIKVGNKFKGGTYDK